MLKNAQYSSDEKQQEALHRECFLYAKQINQLLKDQKLDHYLPFDLNSPDLTKELLKKLRDGVVLGHLIHQLDPASLSLKKLTINLDMSTLKQQNTKTLFQVNENLNYVLSCCQKLSKDFGLVVINIGSSDILYEKVDLVFGLLWQLVRAHLLREVSLTQHPELIRLLKPDEKIDQLLRLPSEQILLRWANFHLAKSSKHVYNFGSDWANGEMYIDLLKAVVPSTVSNNILEEAKAIQGKGQENLIHKAKLILSFCDQIGCSFYTTPADIVNGHARLNIGLISRIFNRYIGIVLPSDEEIRQLMTKLRDSEKENVTLKGKLQQRDDEMQEMLAELKNIQRTFKKRDEEREQQIQSEMHQLMIQHQKEMEQQKIYDEEMQTLREKELQNMLESVKAKHKQQISKMERDYERQTQNLFRSMNGIKKCLQDFLIKNDLAEETALNIERNEQDIEKLPNDLQELMVRVLEGYYAQTDQCEVLERKLGNFQKLNEVYADKIQEFAETLCRKPTKKTSFMNLFAAEKNN